MPYYFFQIKYPDGNLSNTGLLTKALSEDDAWFRLSPRLFINSSTTMDDFLVREVKGFRTPETLRLAGILSGKIDMRGTDFEGEEGFFTYKRELIF